MDDVYVTRLLSIPDAEISESFARSGGPGGQNVNKTATKAEVRWSVADSAVLTEPDRNWLFQRLRSRLTNDGVLIVTSSATRDQSRNRQDARDRLAQIVRKALQRPKRRKKTRPSRASVRRRISNKRHRGKVKKLRKPPKRDD